MKSPPLDQARLRGGSRSEPTPEKLAGRAHKRTWPSLSHKSKSSPCVGQCSEALMETTPNGPSSNSQVPEDGSIGPVCSTWRGCMSWCGGLFLSTRSSPGDTFGVCAQEQDWRGTTPLSGRVDTLCVSRLWRALHMHLDDDLLWGED